MAATRRLTPIEMKVKQSEKIAGGTYVNVNNDLCSRSKIDLKMHNTE